MTSPPVLPNNDISTNPQLTHHSLHLRVRAFSSMRKGEMSGGQCGEFNTNPYCRDAPDAVMMNRGALCAKLQIDDAHLLVAHQVHDTETRVIAEEFSSLSPSTRQRLLGGADALITAIPHVRIDVPTADRTPVLLYDEEHHVIAAVHVGWRETMARIMQKTVAAMQQSYHTRPVHLYACIGPGISLRHFEIGDEAYQALAQASFNMPVISQHMDEWHINLSECDRLQPLEVGVSDDQILSIGICTYEQVDAYLSAQRSGIQSRRIYNGIILL